MRVCDACFVGLSNKDNNQSNSNGNTPSKSNSHDMDQSSDSDSEGREKGLEGNRESGSIEDLDNINVQV